MKQENKKRLVRELKRIYEGPKPVGKQAFLAEMREREENPLNWPKIGRGHMLAVQLRYISKGVWALSLVIFFTILWSSRYVEEDLRWAVCAGIPFLGMVMILESFRSMACGMEELELSCRFSLKNVVLARMGILGCGNLLLLLTFAVFMEGRWTCNVLYFLFPYLLTCFGCLLATRRLRGREGLYVCAGIAAAVSCLESWINNSCKWMLEAEYGGFWFLAVGVILALTVREGFHMIEKTEELIWN